MGGAFPKQNVLSTLLIRVFYGSLIQGGASKRLRFLQNCLNSDTAKPKISFLKTISLHVL